MLSVVGGSMDEAEDTEARLRMIDDGAFNIIRRDLFLLIRPEF